MEFAPRILCILCLLILAKRVAAQGEILGISSYDVCIQIDTSARDTSSSTPRGTVGQFLNCTSDDPLNPDFEVKVTVIDLLLSASVDSNSQFLVDLVVVPDEDNRQRANLNGSVCGANPGVNDPNDPVPSQDCVLTTPTTITIDSTEFVFYYPLQQLTDTVTQYCYMGYFNALSAVDLVLPDNYWPSSGNIFGCTAFVTVKNCGPNGPVTLCANDIDTFDATGNLSLGIIPDGKTAQMYWEAVPNSGSQTCDGRATRTMFSYDSIRKLENTSPPSCRGTEGQDPNTFKTNHSTLISDPQPFPLRFSAGKVYENVLQAIQCGGENCGIFNFFAYSLNEDGSQCPTTTFDVCSAGMTFWIYQLRPLCYIFEISQTPSVAVNIEMTVTPQGRDPETLLISNIMGLQRNSSNLKLIDARVISVDTLDGYLGPSLGGYISICGGVFRRSDIADIDPYRSQTVNTLPDITTTPFFDMRLRALPASLANDTVLNPWDTIIEHVPSPSGRYYPNNKFMTFSSKFDLDPDSLGRNAETPFGGDPYSVGNYERTQIMWYYIQFEKTFWLDKGCNQLAFTDQFWNTNFYGGEPNRQTSIQQCELGPFTCIPGLTNATFGGRSIPGCLASAAFNNMITYTDEQLDTNPGTAPNADLIREIAAASMPPRYVDTAPNYWLASVGPTNALFYKPDPSEAQADVTFEVLVDLVGTFVQYTSTVANGRITDVVCNGTINDFSNGFVTVQNTGLIDGTYVVDIECPTDSGITAVAPSTLNYGLLNPNETDTQSFTFVGSVVPQNSLDPCILVLRPGDANVFVVLQELIFTCTVLDADIPPSPNDTDVNVSMPGIFEIDCGSCDFECIQAAGKSITTSWCFWIISSFFILSIVLSIASCSIYIGYNYSVKKDSEKFVESLKRAARGDPLYSTVQTQPRNLMSSQDFANIYSAGSPMGVSEAGTRPPPSAVMADETARNAALLGKPE